MSLKKQRKTLIFPLVAIAATLSIILNFVFPTTQVSASTNYTAHKVAIKPIVRAAGSTLATPLSTPDGKVIFKCQSNTPPSYRCYGPDQIRKAYGLDKLQKNHNVSGKNSTIIIIDAYGSPTLASDLASFDKIWGIPDPKLTVVNPYGLSGTNFNWGIETTLDVEWSHVFAPSANIVLVAAKSSDDTDIYNATKYAIDNSLGDVLSQSFGENESVMDPILEAAQHTLFQQATKKGITLFASAGDSGSTQLMSDGFTPTLAVSTPASDPLVTAVGGTALTADIATGVYSGETAWNESTSGNGATGGGYSIIYGQPDYQKDTIGKQSGRGLPDVALNASVDGGVLVAITDPTFNAVVNYIVGGTSVSSPEFAGLTADGVQMAKHRLGFLNKAFYHLGQHSDTRSAIFNDITSGTNIVFGSGVQGYSTTKGWDPVTGWGSPSDAGSLLRTIIDAQHHDDADGI